MSFFIRDETSELDDVGCGIPIPYINGIGTCGESTRLCEACNYDRRRWQVRQMAMFDMDDMVYDFQDDIMKNLVKKQNWIDEIMGKGDEGEEE